MPNTQETLRKFQVFRNGGTPIISTPSDIKVSVASLISSGSLVLNDGELIDVRYKFNSEDTVIRSLFGVAYVDHDNQDALSIAWTSSTSDFSIVSSNETYATIQLNIEPNGEGGWRIASTVNPNSLRFNSSTASGVTTYTLQVKNNSDNNWVDTDATFTVDVEKFVNEMKIVTGTWDTSQMPHVFTPSASGKDLAIELDYSIGGASSIVYVEIPQSVYMEAITGGDVWVSDGSVASTTIGHTYIRLMNEAGEYVYVDVTTLVNVITSVTGEAALNGNTSYVAVHATTNNGAVTLSSELKHSTVSVNSNDSLTGTDGVLTNSNLSAIESYVDNYDCGTYTFGS